MTGKIIAYNDQILFEEHATYNLNIARTGETTKDGRCVVEVTGGHDFGVR